jgi:hypothetical protein
MISKRDLAHVKSAQPITSAVGKIILSGLSGHPIRTLEVGSEELSSRRRFGMKPCYQRSIRVARR